MLFSGVVDDGIRMFNDANCDEDYIRDTHQGYIEYLEQFCCLDKNRDRRISLEEYGMIVEICLDYSHFL